jgi:hypothetical protein
MESLAPPSGDQFRNSTFHFSITLRERDIWLEERREREKEGKGSNFCIIFSTERTSYSAFVVVKESGL